MSCWGENVFHPGFSCVRCAYTGDQLAAARTKTVTENLRIAAGISSSVALSMAGITSLSALSGWWEQRRAHAQREPLDSFSIHSTAMAKKRKRPDRLLDRALSGVLGKLYRAMRGAGSGAFPDTGVSTVFPLFACAARNRVTGSCLRTGMVRFSPSRVNVRQDSFLSKSMQIKSPTWTCSVARRLASG